MKKETVERIIEAYEGRKLRLYTDMHYIQTAHAFSGYAKGFLPDTSVLLVSDKNDGGNKVSFVEVDHILFIETLDD